MRRERKKKNLPSIKVSGNSGASAMRSPPNPQPISANSTRGVSLRDATGAFGPVKYFGKWMDQSISAGEVGLQQAV